ncbi:MAG: BsuBI/PstI family type II restriction endonuclease [Prosthecobacter sp.]
MFILQPKVEYPNMGNSIVTHRHAVAPRRDDLSRSVEKLASTLRLPKHLLAAHSLRLPDGALHYTPRFRWCLLIKAIIEHFCPAFAPGGVVLYIGDTENKFVHLETAGLTALGVTLDSAAKIPDVIVHDTKRNWLLLIEAVTSAGPVDGKRRKELKDLFAGCKAGLVFVTAFESRRTMQTFVSHIAWESEVWIAEDPDHMIHFNGERFLGPYPDVMPKHQ